MTSSIRAAAVCCALAGFVLSGAAAVACNSMADCAESCQARATSLNQNAEPGQQYRCAVTGSNQVETEEQDGTRNRHTTVICTCISFVTVTSSDEPDDVGNLPQLPPGITRPPGAIPGTPFSRCNNKARSTREACDHDCDSRLLTPVLKDTKELEDRRHEQHSICKSECLSQWGTQHLLCMRRHDEHAAGRLVAPIGKVKRGRLPRQR